MREIEKRLKVSANFDISSLSVEVFVESMAMMLVFNVAIFLFLKYLLLDDNIFSFATCFL